MLNGAQTSAIKNGNDKRQNTELEQSNILYVNIFL
jgi:hypothetical protein